MGRLVICFCERGDAIGAFDGGSISLQAGSALDGGGGNGGDLLLAPGGSVGGSAGAVHLADAATATPAQLTAFAAFNVIPVAGGLLRLGTEFGAVEITFAGGEDLAATLGLINATGTLTATEALGIITIHTTSVGLAAEVYFLAADAGIEAALGGLALSGGAVFAPGNWPDTIAIGATGPDVITFGIGAS